LWRERQLPWRGSARGWLATTRSLSGWFTATAVVAQMQVQAVVFLVGFQLSKVEITGLRFVQTVQIQPVQNFISAVQGLLVPRASRAAQDAAGDTDAQRAAGLARLRRQTSLMTLAMLGFAVVLVLVGWPLVSWLLARSARFEPFEPVALPIALQAGVYLVQMPYTAALRGMHRAKLLFAQYVVFSAASIGGLVVGAGTGGLLGAAWGLFSGAVLGLIVMLAMYRFAVRALATREH
jgi:O-antigen/teichoic acid export membrane protein